MYDPQPTKDYCEQLGLGFAEDDFNLFCEQAKFHEFTQEQVDFAMMQHAWRIKVLFNPKMYNIINRILIAFHFLNPFAKGL